MKPLDNLTVVEVGQVVSAPFSGMLFADMGADVLKIERPETGDSQRHTTPGSHSVGDFEFLNRNKRSIELNLGSESGQQIFDDLLAEADILIENLSPGAFDRLGLPFEQLVERHDGLIIGSIKGFGAGPYEDRLGMDHPIEVESGITYMTGLSDQPLRVGFSVVDISSATYLVVGALSMVQRLPLPPDQRHFTVGMFESAALLMGQPMAYATIEGEAPVPLNEGIFKWAVYDYFDTADGEKVFVGLVSDAQWERFAMEFGLEDLLQDPDLQDESARVEQRPRIQERVGAALADLPRAEVLNRLDEIRVPYAPFQTPADLLEDDHLSAGDKYVTWEGDDGEIRLPIPPMEGSFFEYETDDAAAPRLGADTAATLRDLGYSWSEIEQLQEKGVIGDPDTE